MKRLLLALTCVAALTAACGDGKGTSGGSVGTDQNEVPSPSNSPAATLPAPPSPS